MMLRESCLKLIGIANGPERILICYLVGIEVLWKNTSGSEPFDQLSGRLNMHIVDRGRDEHHIDTRQGQMFLQKDRISGK